jgi:hypothetical protein
MLATADDGGKHSEERVDADKEDGLLGVACFAQLLR